MHTTLHHDRQIAASTAPSRDTFDWAGQIRLGIVLSAAVLIVTIGLGGLISEPVLVVGSMLVASILAWRRVDARRIAPTPHEVHLTRR